uniref:uncharacterized protein LOC114589896 n=1 Tax=Podarcis muralis TaxID=64176 RepID=UPI0010A004EF|nr:uncharacterized protein LOC114589896 [Podarcis muralis]
MRPRRRADLRLSLPHPPVERRQPPTSPPALMLPPRPAAREGGSDGARGTSPESCTASSTPSPLGESLSARSAPPSPSASAGEETRRRSFPALSQPSPPTRPDASRCSRAADPGGPGERAAHRCAPRAPPARAPSGGRSLERALRSSISPPSTARLPGLGWAAGSGVAASPGAAGSVARLPAVLGRYCSACSSRAAQPARRESASERPREPSRGQARRVLAPPTGRSPRGRGPSERQRGRWEHVGRDSSAEARRERGAVSKKTQGQKWSKRKTEAEKSGPWSGTVLREFSVTMRIVGPS